MEIQIINLDLNKIIFSSRYAILNYLGHKIDHRDFTAEHCQKSDEAWIRKGKIVFRIVIAQKGDSDQQFPNSFFQINQEMTINLFQTVEKISLLFSPEEIMSMERMKMIEISFRDRIHNSFPRYQEIWKIVGHPEKLVMGGNIIRHNQTVLRIFYSFPGFFYSSLFDYYGIDFYSPHMLFHNKKILFQSITGSKYPIMKPRVSSIVNRIIYVIDEHLQNHDGSFFEYELEKIDNYRQEDIKIYLLFDLDTLDEKKYLDYLTERFQTAIFKFHSKVPDLRESLSAIFTSPEFR